MLIIALSIIPCLSSYGEDTQTKVPQILKDIGYPENKIESIATEFEFLYKDIDFEKFRKQAQSIDKTDMKALKEFFIELIRVLGKNGYLQTVSPKTLNKLLVISLIDEDIFEVLQKADIDEKKKAYHQRNLLACATISQLAYIILHDLGFDICVARGSGHVSVFYPISDDLFLLIDFSLLWIKEINLITQYQKDGEYIILKPEFRIILPNSLLIKAKENRLEPENLTANERLNLCFLYLQIDNKYAATLDLHNNIGITYNDLGRYDGAIVEYKEAIRLNLKCAEAHNNLGNTYKA
jgi:tetratricopeptide (TPR) repeat protein